ncbi:MAG: HAD-IIA family hydrolase [Fimbriimonadaceae bacterium]
MRLYPLYIFDLDGTLFRGEEPTPNAVETVGNLRRAGSQVRFLTNNSSKSISDLTEKLNRLGFEAAHQEVMNSAEGTARRLAGKVNRVFVVGESALVEALGGVGIELVDRDPEAVVVGIDRQFTYEKMSRAMTHLRNPDCLFVASNPDRSYPLENDVLIPGAGSIVAAIEMCSARKAEVIGKPNPFLVELVLDDAKVLASDCLVVGDRLETDIEAGRAAKCDVHLVLCGVTKEPIPGLPWSPDLAVLTVV